MSNSQSIFYANEKHGKSQVRTLDYIFQITGAKASGVLPRGAEILPLYDATTQSVIDAYLGSTNEILAAQFDSTAMGTDAFGGLINMNGQCASVISVEVSTASGATGSTVASSVSLAANGMTPSSLTVGCAVTPAGNIAFRSIVTGLDALTSGQIKVIVRWVCN